MLSKEKEIIAIGLMSGSSLDGVDLAAVRFFIDKNNEWRFEMMATECVSYSAAWTNRLKNCRLLDGLSLWQLHTDLGHLYGEMIKAFIQKSNLKNVSIIGSHGHTVFHFPEKRFTSQIGDGAAIFSHVNIPVVCDFRSLDVALGGQGTPIVPIGDQLLFADYALLLNIGGIANISAKIKNEIIAFDVCAANQVLNYFAQKAGKLYDENGELARQGKCRNDLIQELNDLNYYQLDFPKSLDNGYSKEVVIPLIEKYSESVENSLATYVEHMADQLCFQIEKIQKKFNDPFDKKAQMLLSGGGALNTFLVEKINEKAAYQIVVPSEEVIQYKEALVMAFMAVRRLRGETNVLQSVTGASQDNCGGAIYGFPNKD